MAHKFRIGQTVQLLQSNRRPGTSSSSAYKVIRQLPETDGEPGYRIKSVGESFERVAMERQLVKA
jgi:hypothetical protein